MFPFTATAVVIATGTGAGGGLAVAPFPLPCRWKKKNATTPKRRRRTSNIHRARVFGGARLTAGDGGDSSGSGSGSVLSRIGSSMIAIAPAITVFARIQTAYVSGLLIRGLF